MRAKSKLLALALTAALQPAFAGMVSLDFEDTTGYGQVGNRYDSLGVNFTGSAWAVTSALNSCNGIWLFSKAGSCGALLLGDPTLTATSGPISFTIDVAAGFINEFDFVYGIRAGSDVIIQVFDGAGGTGNTLKIQQGLIGGGCGIARVRFCEWSNGIVKFDGTARSLTITGIDQRLMLDDMKFTTPAAGTPLPEPGSIALALGALGALGWTRKRAAR